MLLDQVARLFPVSRYFVSHVGGQRHELTWDGDATIRCLLGEDRVTHWLCQKDADGLMRMTCREGRFGQEDGGLEETLLAVLESAFYFYQGEDSFYLDVSYLNDAFLERYAQLDRLRLPRVERNLFWQRPELWLPNVQKGVSYGTIQSLSRSPLKHQGAVGVTYRRFIPWLGRTFSFRGIRIEEDLERFSRWMNDPFVSHFWEEQGSLDRHRSYLNDKQVDQNILTLLACLDDQPFGYFEVYWAKYDRIAPFCDAEEHDRGWHALIGEEDCRGKTYVCSWLPSLTHYLFLDDERTKRIVVEPRVDNDRMTNNLIRADYHLVKEFDFPHKKANLFEVSRSWLLS
ncbi:MAG: GNAT family N-acetyltransferase [Lautropia sp.]|nr:GNAT family N-acetyltransferase [Lautropia sp.]